MSSSKKATTANPANPTPGPVRLEDYQVEFVGPFLSLLLAGVSYYIWQHFERLDEVGWFESLLVGAGLAVICIILLYLPQILYKAFKNKFYTSVAIILLFPSLFVLSKSAWRTFEYFNTTNIISDDVVKNTAPLSAIVSDALEKTIKIALQSDFVLPTPLHEETKSIFNSEESNPPTFDGNCQKYSKEILSRASLTSPQEHQVKGQVEIFRRTIYLTGKPVGLVLIGKPKEYEAQAMYIMGGRHRHTDAVSHSSAEDAVWKALTTMCENFQKELT